MQVNTKWFGTIEINEDKIVCFDKGLIGLDDYKKFTIIYDNEKEEANNIMWLQSLEDGSFALPVMHPDLVMERYNPIIEDELLKPLGDIEESELVLFVTVTAPSDATQITCNLKAPIIINAANRKACQVLASNEEYPVKYSIYELVRTKLEKGGE